MNIYRTVLTRTVFVRAYNKEQAMECARRLPGRYWKHEELDAVLYVYGWNAEKWTDDEYVDASKMTEE